MCIRLLCLTVVLAAATVAAAAEPEPCTPSKPGAWVPMAVAGGPEIGEVADVRTGFLGRSKWWFWDSFQPLTDGRVFDARCNAWRRTSPARGSTLPKRLDRRYGVLFGDNTLAVYSPTWEAAKDGSFVSGSIGLFVLEGELLQWTNLTPASPPLGPDSQVVAGEGLLVAWDERAGQGAIFTLPTRVSLWNGKRFGPLLTLGIGDEFHDGVHSALGGLAVIDAKAVRVLDVSGKERLRLPAPPRWLAYRGFSPEAFITWGQIETRVGTDCHNPFHPPRHEPNMPICDPSEERVYGRTSPGGFVLLRASGDEAIKK